MASSSSWYSISLIFFFFLFLFTIFSLPISSSFPTSSIIRPLSDSITPQPTPWPEQFHSILVMNFTGSLQIIDLWYDWPNGRNFNIIQNQLGEILHDLEWNNGTSFFYTLEEEDSSSSSSSTKKCSSAQLEVGILRPNWLDGANYLGQQSVDGFLCNVWEKVGFIWYYEDVITKRPVQWVFYTGRTAHVMTFEVGAVLEDIKWQAPSYCFQNREKEEEENDSILVLEESLIEEGILRGSSGSGKTSEK